MAENKYQIFNVNLSNFVPFLLGADPTNRLLFATFRNLLTIYTIFLMAR
ncbi:hypothetical protein AQ1_02057 [alpha proteobacterium Q-1]|nr:hypothetical protein AQ1_02057 [alpha proteobacterium Q-1]